MTSLGTNLGLRRTCNGCENETNTKQNKNHNIYTKLFKTFTLQTLTNQMPHTHTHIDTKPKLEYSGSKDFHFIALSHQSRYKGYFNAAHTVVFARYVADWLKLTKQGTHFKCKKLICIVIGLRAVMCTKHQSYQNSRCLFGRKRFGRQTNTIC